MNQNNKTLLNVIVSGVGMFFSLIAIICTAVNGLSAWEWISVIFLFLGMGAVLAVALMNMLAPSTLEQIPLSKKMLSVAPIATIIISLFLTAIQQLVCMGEIDSPSRSISKYIEGNKSFLKLAAFDNYSRSLDKSYYFTQFLFYFLLIAVLIVVLIAFFKINTKFTLFCVSSTLFLGGYVFTFITYIVRVLVGLATKAAMGYIFFEMSIAAIFIAMFFNLVVVALEEKNN